MVDRTKHWIIEEAPRQTDGNGGHQIRNEIEYLVNLDPFTRAGDNQRHHKAEWDLHKDGGDNHPKVVHHRLRKGFVGKQGAVIFKADKGFIRGQACPREKAVEQRGEDGVNDKDGVNKQCRKYESQKQVKLSVIPLHMDAPLSTNSCSQLFEIEKQASRRLASKGMLPNGRLLVQSWNVVQKRFT